MLGLSRKQGESIYIGNDVTVTVVKLHGAQVRLGIEAAPHMSVERQEIRDRPDYHGRTRPGKETP